MVDKFVVLSAELKQAAEISYHEHVQANPAADENGMPVLFDKVRTGPTWARGRPPEQEGGGEGGLPGERRTQL